MPKYTSSDVQRIAQRLVDARGRKRPAHFLMGAGCSVTAGIPSANALVDMIHGRYSAHLDRLQDNEKRSYGACMALLAANERYALIAPYLEGARINWGAIALAQLMVRGFVGRVLTPNFDLVLQKACALLGLQPAVYDFGAAPGNDPKRIVAPSIIHLHGQSYGLVLLNTEAETAKHRKKIRPILRDSLQSAPVIVIGYSGSADGIFHTFVEEFDGRETLYWVGYEEEPTLNIQPLLAKEYVHFLGSADFDRFMLELARSLDCWPPDLFKDPFGHLLEQLRPIAPYPEADSTSSFDLVKGLQQKIETWRRFEGERSNKLRELFMRDEFDKAVELFSELRDERIDGEGDRDIGASSQLRLGSLKLRAARAAKEKEAKRLLDEAERHYQHALTIKPNMTDALVNQGNLRSWQARLSSNAEAAKLHSESTKKYAAALAIDDSYAPALYNWASSLIDQAKRVSSKKEQNILLAEADEKLKAALKINPTKTYNSACLAAIRGDEMMCRQYLEAALRHGTIPNWEHLSSDPDLDSVRKRTWFKALLARKRRVAAKVDIEQKRDS
jgi:tetratricopeptide (TPR) repeat protein